MARKISMTYQDGSSREFVYPDLKMLRMDIGTGDLASDVVTYTDENGSVFNSTWDCMGRKINVSIAPASGIGGTTSHPGAPGQYDGLNRPTLNQDITGAGTVLVTFFYDSLGRSIEEAPTTLGTSRYVTNTAFTSVPATQFEYPNDRLVDSSFDKLYRRQQIIEQATSVVIASWQFFGPGRVATVTLGNGLVCSNMNNAQSRSAIQSGLPTPGWGSIATDQLGYDGAGRMIGKRFFNGANVIVGFTSAYDMSSDKLFERPLQAEERSSLYDSYDSMNRLLDYQRGVLASGGGSVTTPIALPNTDQSRNYNLDALGNWTSSVYTPEGGGQVTDQRNHNKLNEITQRTVGTNPAITFQYDGTTGASNGNLKNDGVISVSYDALNRPIQISRVSDGLVIATYLYDAMNRRVRKTISNGGVTGNAPNGTTDYIYMGWQVVEERDSSNAPTRQYVWGTYIDECIQLTSYTVLGPQSLPAGAYYLLQDLLYRAVALTNSSGAVVEAYDCDAYGNTLIFIAPGADGQWFTDDDTQSSYGVNEIIYCGYRFDPESELYYARNRSYNSVLGRWLQRDPVGYAGGANLYEYVGGNSARREDPTGLGALPGPRAPVLASTGPWVYISPTLRYHVLHYTQDLGVFVVPYGSGNPSHSLLEKALVLALNGLSMLSGIGAAIASIAKQTTAFGEAYDEYRGHAWIDVRKTYTRCDVNALWALKSVKVSAPHPPRWDDISQLYFSNGVDQEVEFGKSLLDVLEEFKDEISK